jgi:hypothetical protein
VDCASGATGAVVGRGGAVGFGALPNVGIVAAVGCARAVGLACWAAAGRTGVRTAARPSRSASVVAMPATRCECAW